MTPEALAYCEKQTKRIATLEQQNAELLRDMNTAYQQIKTEQRLSFRDQVAGLEAEVAALREVAKAAKVVALHRQTTFDEWERLRDALKGIGAAIDAIRGLA